MRYAKAVAALIGAVATWGIAAGADESYTQVELYGLLGVLGTVVGVYWVPNKDPKGQAQDESVQPPEPDSI